MFFRKKSIQAEKNAEAQIIIPILNHISFGAILHAVHDLDKEVGDNPILLLESAINHVLEVTPSLALQDLAKGLVAQVKSQEQELSDLEAMFNSPSFDKTTE